VHAKQILVIGREKGWWGIQINQEEGNDRRRN